MPELPEVELGRKTAEDVALGRRLVAVRPVADEIVFEGLAPRVFAEGIEGRRVIGVHRHGKQLWFEMEGPPHPLFHFGMTGAFRVPGREALPLEAKLKDDGSWPPRFTKIHLVFEDGGELAMTDARRLGRILLRDDPLREAPLARLGPDVLHGLPDEVEFVERFAGRRGVLKSLLLDQGFLAGIGNWMADEVLHQARLDPRRRAGDLVPTELRRLRRALARVVKKAVAVDADKSRFPADWLFHRRWGRAADARTTRGERIEHLVIGGRTTAWVPARQS